MFLKARNVNIDLVVAFLMSLFSCLVCLCNNVFFYFTVLIFSPFSNFLF